MTALTQNLTQRHRFAIWILFAILASGAVLFAVAPTLASDEYLDIIRDVADQMISIIVTIFQVVGVILAVYAVGQLILAFKNEDSNSKSNATLLLAVSIILIATPFIANRLNITQYIGAGLG